MSTFIISSSVRKLSLISLAISLGALFKGLRYLGATAVTEVYAHLLPEYGLGRAINDRLQRAANK